MARWVPVWAVAALALVLVVAGTPHVGDSRPGYATVATVASVAFFGVCFVTGAVLVLRCQNPVSRLTAMALFLFGGASPPFTNDLAAQPGWFAPARLGSALLVVSLVAFLLVFPSGRVEPRWLRVPAALWGAALIAERLTPALDPAPGTGSDLIGQLTIVGLLAGLGAQMWRWLRVSDQAARNQTKWVVLGGAVTVVASVIAAFLPDGAAQFAVATTGSLGIPVSLALAVLRYRLWDVDLVINRALVYASVTALLAGVYLGVVLTTHAVLDGRGDLGASVAAAALVAIAFQPLRVAAQRLVNRVMFGDRDDPYAVLNRLGAALEEGAGTGGILAHVVATVATAMRLPGVAIALHGAGGQVIATTCGEVSDDAVRLPLTHQGVVVGDLVLASRGPRDPLNPADIRLLEHLSRHIAVAAHAVQLTADLQRSRERLVTARAEERRRLRRELHDGLAPQLVSLAMRLEAARAAVADHPSIDATLETLAERARGSIGEVRRLVNALRPPVLDELGLVGAVRETALGHTGNGSRPAVVFEAPSQIPELPAAVETAAYRIAQEALTNVLRHADAQHCTVALRFDASASSLSLEVADDGRGIQMDATRGTGIISMRERAEELGGHLCIVHATSGGTTLRALLPCGAQPETQSSW
jgi:signal transduction histidine kinase